MPRLLLPLLLLLPACAWGQVCVVTMSFNQCSAAMNEHFAQLPTPEAATTAALEDGLATLNTGGQAASSTTTDDFNPKFQASADTLGVSGESGDAVTLSWADLLSNALRGRLSGERRSATNQSQHHKLIVKLEEAAVFEPVAALITDPAVGEELEESLDDFDNVAVDLRFSLNSQKYGRDLNQHATLISNVQAFTTSQLSGQLDVEAQLANAQSNVLRQLVERGGRFDSSAGDADKPLSEVFAAAPELATQFITATERVRIAQLEYERLYESAARQNGLFTLIDLINNQPQLVVSVESKIRDDLVGPDQHTAKLTYEFGGTNVNRYEKYAAEQREADRLATERDPTRQPACSDEVSCLASYVATRRDGAVSEGSRLALSIEYVGKDAYDFDRAGVQFAQDKESSLIARFAYGRYVDVGFADATRAGRSRIDVTASFEDVRGDPARQNRSIANIVFAQEISRGLFFTLGLAWANKPEFRGAVDEEISARAGISYKLAGE
jgi:hypothetical protein